MVSGFQQNPSPKYVREDLNDKFDIMNKEYPKQKVQIGTEKFSHRSVSLGFFSKILIATAESMIFTDKIDRLIMANM